MNFANMPNQPNLPPMPQLFGQPAQQMAPAGEIVWVQSVDQLNALTLPPNASRIYMNSADAVPGAAASQTAAAAGVVTLPISKLIRVRPSCAAVGNAANLSLQLTGGAGTVTSVNVAIHQIA